MYRYRAMYKGIHSSIANNTNYHERLHKKLEQRKTHQESLSLRNELKQKEKLMNYINEYDRIRGQLSKTHTGNGHVPESKEHLKKRKADLEKIVKGFSIN